MHQSFEPPFGGGGDGGGGGGGGGGGVCVCVCVRSVFVRACDMHGIASRQTGGQTESVR